MLTTESLQSAYNLTELLDARGVKLVSKLGSPLALLCDKTFTPPNAVTRDPASGDVSFDLGVVEYHTAAPILSDAGSATKNSEHDLALDAIAELCPKAVQDHIKLARTIVNPLITDLADSVLKETANLKPSEVLGFEVKPVPLPKPFLNGSLVSMVDKFQDAKFTGIFGVAIQVERSQEELLEDIKTGSSQLDDDVREWLTMHPKGLGLLSEVWNNVFRRQDTNLQFNDWVGSQNEGADYALITFLLARKLIDKPIEDAGVSLVSWNNTLADYREAAAKFVSFAITAAQRDTKNGIIVRGMRGKQVTVFEPAYRAFLEKGGSNEMLFANLLADCKYLTQDDLLENSEKLLAAWNRFTAIDNSTTQVKQRATVKNSFYRNFHRQLSEAKDENPEYRANVNMEGIEKLFAELLDSLPGHAFDLKHVYYTARKLICRTRFLATNVEDLLISIDEIQKENPKLPMREVTALATVNYITDWFFDQLTVKDINR